MRWEWWPPEAPEELPECLDQEEVGELVAADKVVQHLQVVLLVTAQVLAWRRVVRRDIQVTSLSP